MDEYLTPVNDGQASDESLQTQVENAETVNADNSEVTNGEQEQTSDGSQQDTDVQKATEQETHAQTKEENAQYAKVRREAEARVRAEIERQQAENDAKFAERAAQFGWVDAYGNPIKTEAEYWKAVDAQREIDSLVNQGKDPEVARLQVEYERLKNEREAERKAVEEQAKEQAKFNEFYEFYEKATGKEFTKDTVIPQEVFIAAKEQNISLRQAYAEHIALSAIEKEKSIAQGSKTAEANNKNSTTSTGSVSGTGAAEPEFYTKDQVAAMTSAEVHKHFDKIEASMKRWA